MQAPRSTHVTRDGTVAVGLRFSPKLTACIVLLTRGQRGRTYVPLTLWIDEHQGFSPVRLSYSLPPAEPGQPEQVTSDCRVRWKQEAGAWVPTSVRIERRVRGKNSEFCTLSFEWISVNKPIQPELLTPDGLGAPAGTRVVDYREAVPRFVGEVKVQPLPK
jgi:hypothetical protein